MNGTPLNGGILELPAATPSGKGYWMVGSDGGMFWFGDGGSLRLYGRQADPTEPGR